MEQNFLSPEDFEKIMRASTFPEEQSHGRTQLGVSDRLRGTAPQMRNAGRVAVAPNPMEQIAYMLQTQRANKMDRTTLAQQKELIDALRAARGAYGRNAAGMGTPGINPMAQGGKTVPGQDPFF